MRRARRRDANGGPRLSFALRNGYLQIHARARLEPFGKLLADVHRVGRVLVHKDRRIRFEFEFPRLERHFPRLRQNRGCMAAVVTATPQNPSSAIPRTTTEASIDFFMAMILMNGVVRRKRGPNPIPIRNAVYIIAASLGCPVPRFSSISGFFAERFFTSVATAPPHSADIRNGATTSFLRKSNSTSYWPNVFEAVFERLPGMLRRPEGP